MANYVTQEARTRLALHDDEVRQGPTGHRLQYDDLKVGNYRAVEVAELVATPLPGVEEHSFNRAVRLTDEKRAGICSQRGGEYEDSWALENVHTPVLDATLREIAQGIEHQPHVRPERLTAQEKRLIVIAALCDVKLSRYGGAFKDDTPIDLANYLLAHTTWLNEYLGRG